MSGSFRRIASVRRPRKRIRHVYTKSARYYDELYSFKDYDAACAKLHAMIQRAHPGARSLLEVACGTGMYLDRLRNWYEVQGLDIDPDLLASAHRRCPDVELHRADMAQFSLSRSFDVVVCLFSSIAYTRTLTRMRAAVATMVHHLNPGGLLIIEPWFPPERFWTGYVTTNFVDKPELKIVWMYTSERVGGEAVLDIHYLVGTPHHIEHFTERHELGLFTDEEHRIAFSDVGIEAQYDSEGTMGRGAYWGLASRALHGGPINKS